MRYTVYAGEVSVKFSGSKARFNWKSQTLVYDSCGDSVEGNETDGILTDPVVNLEDRDVGSFTCVVPYRAETRTGAVKNQYYDRFKMGKTFILVEEDDECIFFGRVTECELGFNLDKTITAKGILDELDNIQTRLTAGFHTTTDESSMSILTLVMTPDRSMKMDSPVNCMERGNVTVPSEGISTGDAGDQFGSYWSILTNYLLEKHKGKEGYLRLRLANDPGTQDYFFYYDYLMPEDMPQTGQCITYGVNMLDLTYEEKRSSELVNVITAHGTKKVTHGWWIFKSTNYETTSGTWSDKTSVARYGPISKHIYVDGTASTADSLYEAAEKEARNYKQEAEPTLTIRAFDRRDTGENVDKLGYMLYTHILSGPHDIDRWMVCTGVKLPLDAPDSKEFTFGLTSSKLTTRTNRLTDWVRYVKDTAAAAVSYLDSTAT